MGIFIFLTACHAIKFDELKLNSKLLILFCCMESSSNLVIYFDGIWQYNMEIKKGRFQRGGGSFNLLKKAKLIIGQASRS